MIRFGTMSVVLLLAALYGVMRAAMLCCTPVNRVANRLLAALIIALALFTFPYIIGYAGYYDAYPWLSFFPYNVTLAFGPLLYLYVVSMSDALPARWRWHLAPALLQCMYYSCIFSQSLAFKNAWDAQVQAPIIAPLETAVSLVSLALYWTLAWRRHRCAAPQEWSRNLLIALALSWCFWSALSLAEILCNGLTYFQRFPFYLWLAVVVVYLGSDGYRHGATAFAQPAAVAPPEAAPVPIERAVSQAELGERWRQRVIDGKWWRDPELTLAALASQLGTNTSALSRAINEGLGLNFNEMINRMRVDAIIAAMQHDANERSLLDIALAEGFNSKASFNRVFKLTTGETPTEYRRRLARVSTSA